uniref:Integrase catalytic domain-containing protein n=1 Tax=Tanacetum cinerariifolium TaxID=118510 RepID=A0A6L2L0Q0_TANCI|nr:hypothetical protein [Tanacetum cinerariifolium]
MAFLSSPGSTNEVDTANIQVNIVSTPVSTVSSHNNPANLSDATVYAFLANQPNGSQLVHEDVEQIHEDDLEKIDLKWQLALLSMRARRYFQRTSNKFTINRSDTADYDKTKVECFNYHKMGHFARECKSLRNQESKPRNQDNLRKTVNVEYTSSKATVAIDGACFYWSYMADDEVPTNMAFMAFLDSEIQNSKTYSNTCLASVEEQLVFYKKNEIMFCDQIAVLKRDASFRDSKINALNLQIEKLKKEKESLFIPLTIDLSNSGLEEFQHPEFKGYKPKDRNFAPTIVLTKSVIVPISTARQSSTRAASAVSAARSINAAASKPLVNVANPRQNALYKSHSLSRRPFYQQTALKNRNLNNNVNTAKGNKVTSVVGNQEINVVKSSAFWDHDGGYVAFGGGAKGGKITGKGIIKTANESQVLLKVPRKNNMYSFDMKNIVPQKDLTCLLANAINDESVLWHRRLGHINFKNINKLVKDNLVRGLPSKRFENDQTYVACLKGKQHKVFFLATKNKTSRILKSCITEIENLMEKKVKIIRCDNGTEFKNRVIHEFNEEKGIKREYNMARTPQQNRVAERRNKTLIEAARTMVLVVKPYFKTLYELFKDEGIFAGYSTVSKAFRVYNIRTRKVEENLYITFLENKPIITDGGPEWLSDIDALSKSMNYAPVPAGTTSNDFAGKRASFDTGQSSIETRPSQDYILMPLWKDNSLFDSSSQASDGHNKDKHVNTATPNYADYPNDPLMPDLKDAGIFDDAYDDRDEGAESDYNNLETTKIHVDNESAICVVKNLVYHSKTKHIKIRHHFIRDSYEKRLIEMVKIHTDYNVAEAWIKGLKLKEYMINDGYANLVQHAVTELILLMFSILDFINTTNGHKFTMSNRQERIGYSRANEYWQIRATIDGKAVVILESLIRSDLLFDDEDDKDKDVKLVSQQGEVQETAKPSKDDDDATLTETLLNIRKSITKDKGKGIMQETELLKKVKKREMLQLSLDKNLAQKLYAEELAKETTRQKQEKYNLEKALKLQRQLDKMEKDLEKESSKKQKLDQQTEEKEEEVEVQADSDQEVEEMKLYMRIVPDEDIKIDAIPLATKPA